jgi:limonene-1,2-epoxide hydrolase
MGAAMTVSEVAMSFVAAINERSIDRLSKLITDDHRFIDALDNRIEGRNAIVKAWRGYFSMVPDYEIKIEKLLERESEVALFGRAGGTYVRDGIVDPKNRWEIPAALLAEVRGEQVSVWRVFADNFPLRRLMGIEH